MKVSVVVLNSKGSHPKFLALLVIISCYPISAYIVFTVHTTL